jgi:hypothetical protein
MYKCECGSLFDKPKTIYWEDEQWDECPQCKSTNYEPLTTNNMNITINAMELASELAHDIVCAKFNDDDNLIYIEDADSTHYTDNAQEVFNEWYDRYLHKIEQYYI